MDCWVLICLNRVLPALAFRLTSFGKPDCMVYSAGDSSTMSWKLISHYSSICKCDYHLHVCLYHESPVIKADFVNNFHLFKTVSNIMYE